MPHSQPAGLLLDAWDDFDRALDGLTDAEAVDALPGESSFAWTAAHVANQLDAWANVRFQRFAPHPLISDVRFRIGGSGRADAWPALRKAIDEVRDAARPWLEGLSDANLELTIPYDGSFAHLRERGLNLRYALLRTVAHHYFHIGEIAAKRSRLGHATGDYPGLLPHTLPTAS